VEQKKQDSQPLKLNRIVVPANVRIVPVESVPSGVAANTAVVPPKSVVDAPETPDEKAGASLEPTESPIQPGEDPGTIKRMAIIAAGLVVAIFVMLLTYNSDTTATGPAPADVAVLDKPAIEPGIADPLRPVETVDSASVPPEPFWDTPEVAAAKPPAFGTPSQLVIEAVEPTSAEVSPAEPLVTTSITSSVDLAAIRPVQRPLRFEKEPNAVVAVQPTPTSVIATPVIEDPIVAAPAQDPPVVSEVIAIAPVAMAPKPIETDSVTATFTAPVVVQEPVQTAPSSEAFIRMYNNETMMDRLTYGTVAALRTPSATLPTAAESAVFGFVRSLNNGTRSEDEITRMLLRAQAAQALIIPKKYLFENGTINTALILSEVRNQ